MVTRPRRHAAALAFGVLAASAPASTAHAATYEQLSRATGVAGQSSLAPSIPLFASDLGIGGGFTRYDSGSTFPPSLGNFARVTALNATASLPSGNVQIAAINATETIALFGTLDFTNSTVALSVGPLYGKGVGKPVGTLSLSAIGSSAMSGDGKTVVLSDIDGGTRTVNVATGAMKVLTPDYTVLSKNSVSDDGSVIAGGTQTDPYAFGPDGSVIFRGGTVTKLGGAGAAVSPNGAVVTYLEHAQPQDGSAPATTLVTRVVATGVEQRVPTPAAAGQDPRLIWIAPSGDKVAIGPNFESGVAQVVSRATGAWNTFGAQVAGEFAGQDLIYQTNDQPARISRNGRFAAVRYNAQVSLESLTGTSLIGGGDTLSAGSYLASQGAACGYGGTPATFDGHFASVPAWLPQPRKATLTVIADGKTLKTATSTAPRGYSEGGDDPAFHVDFPAGTKSATVKYSVIDQYGRTATESFVKTLGC